MARVSRLNGHHEYLLRQADRHIPKADKRFQRSQKSPATKLPGNTL
jgi:hypothetical protein